MPTQNSTANMLTDHLQSDNTLLDDNFAAPRSTENVIYDIPEADEAILTFFFPFYHYYTSPMGRLPNKPVDDESELPAPFRTYASPTWTKWADIWNQPSIELNTDVLPIPDLELIFQSTLFRLTLNAAYFEATQECRTIRQGTMFTFKDYNHEDIRFVVEWLQFVHNHDAYLKIVAMTSTGQRFPYSDPDFPSFILIAPLCLVYVPTPPPGLELYYAYPLDLDNEEIEDGRDVELCTVCNYSF